jgi:nitrous-oxide reductase
MVYGLPSGRLLRIVPVFSEFPENGYGFSEETKPMLTTSMDLFPWMICIMLNFLRQTERLMDGGYLEWE